MAEVYTISGAELGAWAIDPNTRRGIIVPPGTPGSYPTREAAEKAALAQTVAARGGGAPAAAPSSAAAPVQLQNALKALGTMAGDPTLTKLKVDGIIGPNTVKAANYAITKYGPFGPHFQKGNLHIGTVRSYAGGLAQVITQHIQSRGGSVPPPQIKRAVARIPSGGGMPASIPEAPPPDRKWIWWVVGGVSVLVVLAVATRAVRGSAPAKRRQPAEA